MQFLLWPSLYEEVWEISLETNDRFGVATYDLDKAKELIELGRLRVTEHAFSDAVKLGYASEEEIGDRILKLRKTEIYKTMPAKKCPGMWQDVYRTDDDGIMIYIKIQINNNIQTIVVSFEKK